MGYAMKRVAAGVHLPTAWLLEPAKRTDDRADYCLECRLLPSANTRYTFSHLSEVGRGTVVRARPNEHFQRTGPPSNAD